MTTFNWLHFTDLHRGMGSQKGWWSDWEHKLFEDLRGRHSYAGPWDVVLFTGDLTDRGTKDQFQQLDTFLTRLWSLFDQLQPGRPIALLAVPGNHDLQRPDPERNPADKDFESELELLAEWTRPERAKIRHRFWNEPTGRLRTIVHRAFSDYQAWWDARRAAMPAWVTVHAGIVPGDFAATVEKDGAKIGILGLNSAFLQLAGGDYKGRLALDHRQFDKACGKSGPEWAREHHFCLLLTHHPTDWLCTEAQGELGRILHGQFAMHLYGHMHETGYRTLSIGGGAPARYWQGLSLFGEETWEGGEADRRFGYAIGKVALKGNEGELRLWPRRAPRPDGGQWKFVPDHDHCQLDESSHNATCPETIKLHRELVAKVAAPVVTAPASLPAPDEPVPTPESKVASSRDSRRFRVLLLATDADLTPARANVMAYVERALGVEVSAGPANPAVDPGSFDQIILFQGQRWEDGKISSVWARAPADRRVAFLSDPDGDWPPYRLTERLALDKVEAFRASLGAAQKFAEPSELPEKVGALVNSAIARRGTGPDRGLKPWERAYLGYSVEVWRGGRTAASRSYLLDSVPRDEPYTPELYTALDGVADGWVCGADGKPRRGEEGEHNKPLLEDAPEARIPLARWASCADFPRLAVVGAPGAGKTVFITRIAASLGAACLGRAGDLEKNIDLDALRIPSGRLPVPIVVEATRLAKQDLNRGLDALLTAIGEELAKGGHEHPSAAAVREGLEQGRYYLLIDALDEIANAEQRRRVLDLLRGVGKPECFPGTRLLLTTRSAAYTGDLRFGGFGVVHVAPLSREQMGSFCVRWSRHRRKDDSFTAGLQTAVESLSGGRLDEPPLTSNPLMLTAVCLIYEKHRTLPDDRGRLCQLLTDDLCRSRRSEDPDHGWQLDEAAKKRLLQRIALAMQVEGAQSWPEARALVELRQTLPVGEAQPDLRASRHLQWIAEHTGLLRFEPSGDEEQIRFWHRLFREYLSASELAQRDRTVRDLVDELWARQWLSDPFWEDVIRLLPRALGTPEKAQLLAGRMAELAQEHAEARGRLLGLVAAGMIESREMFPGIDFESLVAQIAQTYERDSTMWSLRDRWLVLSGLARLDLRHGDPRLRAERWISFPGGEVILGDTLGDLIAKKIGSPPRKTTVAPFAMAWAPVSSREYLEFLDSKEFVDKRFWIHAPRKIRGQSSQNLTKLFRSAGSTWQGTIFGVSIYEALAYCAWRTAHRTDGRVVRLPTESEWEYAARADGGSLYPWGAEMPAASHDWTGRGWSGIEKRTLHAYIGLFPPIAGVVDLVGSAAQWCDSLFSDPYGERLTEKAKNHGGVIPPSWRAVLRGGIERVPSNMALRCAFRTGASGEESPFASGFRLVLDPPP
ncbi:SUMF1/EgtB/PvdO family nonheme iron enzyme [Sorangium sp. So ce388]|uniref:SUMF1/EgtB/PvdO family nonheme iron enzyme n=1 Tax=Sorangium sp. So ce388 TaxID=3133309 RepID=UPI003F5C3234